MSKRIAKVVIHRQKDSNGEWLSNEENISREACTFFSTLFSQEEVTEYVSLDHIPKILLEEDISTLKEFLSVEEVQKIIFSIDGDSAMKLDRFTRKFFTHAWEIISKISIGQLLAFSEEIITKKCISYHVCLTSQDSASLRLFPIMAN